MVEFVAEFEWLLGGLGSTKQLSSVFALLLLLLLLPLGVSQGG